MNAHGTVSGRLSGGAHLSAGLATGAHLAGSLTIPASSGVPVYDGSVEVTPSTEEQVIHTDHRMVLSDITINPIPSNYGLITWDGSTITVS